MYIAGLEAAAQNRTPADRDNMTNVRRLQIIIYNNIPFNTRIYLHELRYILRKIWTHRMGIFVQRRRNLYTVADGHLRPTRVVNP